MRSFELLLLLLAVVASGSAQDIIEVTRNSGLTAVLQLLRVAGMEYTLRAPGPFTLLAPSDQAFNEVDPYIIQRAIEDPVYLKRLLSYHVIEGALLKRDLIFIAGGGIETVQGDWLEFSMVGDDIIVNEEANITKANILASNGVIHFIDAVLIPEEDTDEDEDDGEEEETDNDVDNYDYEDEEMDYYGGKDNDYDVNYYNFYDDFDGNYSDSDMDLVDVAEIEGLDTFVFLAHVSGVADDLRRGGPYTILAPHEDVGFNTADPVLMDRAMSDPDFMLTLLSAHILPGILMADNITDGLTMPNMQGGSVVFSVADDGQITLNNANISIIYSDITASNGVIHIIDSVLMPVLVEPGNLLEVAAAAGLNTITELIAQAWLQDKFTSEGPLTLFAPTDEAFNKLPDDIFDQVMANPLLLVDLLLHHATAEYISSRQFKPDRILPSLLDGAMGLRISFYPNRMGAGVVSVDGSSIQRMDIPASNGVLHIINKILLPPAYTGDIVDVLEMQEDLTIFTSLVAQLNLTEFFRLDGPLTILAPVDEAFEAMPKSEMEKLSADEMSIQRLVLSHIIPGALYTNGMGGQVRRTIGGGPVAFKRSWIDSNTLLISSYMTTTNFVFTDFKASNGVVHKIGNILRS